MGSYMFAVFLLYQSLLVANFHLVDMSAARLLISFPLFALFLTLTSAGLLYHEKIMTKLVKAKRLEKTRCSWVKKVLSPQFQPVVLPEPGA